MEIGYSDDDIASDNASENNERGVYYDLFEEKDQLDQNSDLAPFTPEKNLNSGTKQDDKGEADKKEIVKIKRKTHVLTFKSDRLTSEKGLYAVVNEFPRMEFQGDGHEARDLKLLMRNYEHWGNRLFPKLRFSDLLDRIDTFGSKKDVRDCMARIRRGGRVPWSSDIIDDQDDPVLETGNEIRIRDESIGEMEQELVNQETERLAETSNDDIDELFELAGFD